MRSWCLERRVIVNIFVRARTLTPEFDREPSDEVRPTGVGRKWADGGHSVSKNVTVSAYLSAADWSYAERDERSGGASLTAGCAR